MCQFRHFSSHNASVIVTTNNAIPSIRAEEATSNLRRAAFEFARCGSLSVTWLSYGCRFLLLLLLTVATTTHVHGESIYYEFLGDTSFVDEVDEIALAVLELSELPATHEQIVSLTFTDAGRFIIGLDGLLELPEIYQGTFDTTIGLFLSDGERGLISEQPFADAYIRDVDSYPNLWFVLGARYGKALNEAIDEIGFVPAGCNYCYATLGAWRHVKQPGSGKSFSDWADSKGYYPGDAMPTFTWAQDTNIETLHGINAYDWNTSPTTSLELSGNVITQLMAGTFGSMHELFSLDLSNNELSTIEDGAFRGLGNLFELDMRDNPALTELNFAEAEFLSLVFVDVQGNANVKRVSFKDATLNQKSLRGLFQFGYLNFGISGLDGVTEIDFSGVDFIQIDDLSPLYEMDDLTDLWLVGTNHLDPFELDALLDELATIEGTDVEGFLHMTQADFNAFNTAGGGLLAAWHAEPGHHVQFVTIPEPATGLLISAASCFVLAWKRSVDK